MVWFFVFFTYFLFSSAQFIPLLFLEHSHKKSCTLSFRLRIIKDVQCVYTLCVSKNHCFSSLHIKQIRRKHVLYQKQRLCVSHGMFSWKEMKWSEWENKRHRKEWEENDINGTSVCLNTQFYRRTML